MAGTANYNWNKPTVGGSTGVWGEMLNSIFDAIDSALFGVEGTADAALPMDGSGAMTGELKVLTDSFAVEDVASDAGAVDLDLSLARFFRWTVTENTTVSITGTLAADRFYGVILEVTNGGAFTVTWPAGTKWPNGVAPELTAAGLDVIVLYTTDGGATWNAARGMEDSK